MRRISPITLFLATGFWLLASLLSCSRADTTPKVYVLSPHASDIRLEFTRAFAVWHKQKYGYEVKIVWPDYGGTSDIVRYLSTQYTLERQTCGYDVFFGGGSGTFDDLVNRGYLEKAPLPQTVLDSLPPNRTGVTMRGKDDLWLAATMSNFGFAINKVRLRELNLPMPNAWPDIAAPQWQGQLSLADPSKSGSVRTAYELVLQQYGWEKGWGILARMFANADAVKDGGSNPAEETDLGNTAAGVVIDFFARNHVAKLGPDVMAFVVPEGGSTLDADPIGMLKGAPNKELAAHLIEFVTSPDGQKVWTFRPGTPGGPRDRSLGRLSIHESLYTDPALAQNLFDKFNPHSAPTLKFDRAAQAARSKFLGDLIKATLVDNHRDLAAARKALAAAGNPKDRDALFDTLPRFSVPARDLTPNPADPKTLTKGQQQTNASIAKLRAAFKAAGREDALTTGLDNVPLTADLAEVLAVYFTSTDPRRERIQTSLRDAWRDRYRDLAARIGGR